MALAAGVKKVLIQQNETAIWAYREGRYNSFSPPVFFYETDASACAMYLAARGLQVTLEPK